LKAGKKIVARCSAAIGAPRYSPSSGAAPLEAMTLASVNGG
jgi:hypothetical protein